MIEKMLIGVFLGAGIGGLIGLFSKLSGGSCPIFCNPLTAMLTGAILGGFAASSFTTRNSQFVPSTNVQHVSTPVELDKLLLTNNLTLVDFYAEWCGPCQTLKPRIHALADEYKGRVAFVAVNVDHAPELAERHKISSIPDVRLFRGNVQVDSILGARPAQYYSQALITHLQTTLAPKQTQQDSARP